MKDVFCYRKLFTSERESGGREDVTFPRVFTGESVRSLRWMSQAKHRQSCTYASDGKKKLICTAVFVLVIKKKRQEQESDLTSWRSRWNKMMQVTSSFSFVQLGPVLPMSKWQMTTSQAVSIRVNSVACGRFTLVDSNILFFRKHSCGKNKFLQKLFLFNCVCFSISCVSLQNLPMLLCWLMLRR